MIINRFAQFLLIGLRPLLGPAACRHVESCGNFALRMLKEETFLVAGTKITKRLLSCHPWGSRSK